MEQHTRVYVFLLRFMAALMAVVALVVIAMPPEAYARNPRLGSWTGLVLSLGAAVALLAIASLMSRQSKAPSDSSAAYARLEHQMTQLYVKLNDLALMSDRNSRAQNATTMIPGRDYTSQLAQLSASIAEVRELTLMNPKERQQKLRMDREHRKDERLKELSATLSARDWARAERLLSGLENEFPKDKGVTRARDQLDDARRAVEEETVVREILEIERLAQAAKWEEARRRSVALTEGFPGNADAQVLKQRVEHEYQFYRETAVRTMIRDIRAEAERRNWQGALECATELVAFYPEHQLVEAIAAQIPTLQANLEIEKRQGIEIKLQELIRDGKIDQAIELAEDTIHRYPNSPQAESLEKLLPRIRDLATRGANEFAGFGHEVVNPFRAHGTVDHADIEEVHDTLEGELEDSIDEKKNDQHPV